MRAADHLYLDFRPVYFISSNPHSLPNLLSGFAQTHRAEIGQFALDANPEGLADEWRRLVAVGDAGAQANCLYYLQRAYLPRAA